MNGKISCHENPFEKGQSDLFVVNISEARNNDDFSTQNSQIPQNIKIKHLNQNFIRFQEASQIQEGKSRKQSSQIEFIEIKNQQQKDKEFTGDKTKENKFNQKPFNMVSPNDSNLQNYSEFSLSLEQNKRKPSIVPSTKNQTSLTSRNINCKVSQKQSKIKRQKKPHTEKQVRITEQKCIKYFSEEQIQQAQQFRQREPDSFQASQNLFTQLSKEFEYFGDFSLIRKQMVELALGKKLIIMQNTNEFVTVKQTFSKDYCQCLIKACLNMEQKGGVYQLKNCIYKRNKARFILVSGSQKISVLFFRNFLIRLWEINKLKLKNENIVEFVVNIQNENKEMKQLKKQYTKLYNQLSGISGNEQKLGSLASKFVPKALVTSIKDNFNRLRSPEKYSHCKKQCSYLSPEQRLILLNEKMNKKYFELLSKLKQQKLQLEKSYLQRQLQKQVYFHEFPMWKLWGYFYKNTYELYLKRKQEILGKSSIKEIFQYLQIEEQYVLYKLNSKASGRKNEETDEDMLNVQNIENKSKSCNIVTINDQQTIRISNKINRDKSQLFNKEEIPYKQCIECVDNIASGIMMPQKLLQLLLQFHHKFKSQYSELYANKPLIKLSSMDEQLPVTIFILLMAQIDKEKTTTLNLLGKLQWISKWIEQKQKENSYDNFQTQKEEQISIIKKTIITIQAAVTFIAKEWNLNYQLQNPNNQRY